MRLRTLLKSLVLLTLVMPTQGIAWRTFFQRVYQATGSRYTQQFPDLSNKLYIAGTSLGIGALLEGYVLPGENFPYQFFTQEQLSHYHTTSQQLCAHSELPTLFQQKNLFVQVGSGSCGSNIPHFACYIWPADHIAVGQAPKSDATDDELALFYALVAHENAHRNHRHPKKACVTAAALPFALHGMYKLSHLALAPHLPKNRICAALIRSIQAAGMAGGIYALHLAQHRANEYEADEAIVHTQSEPLYHAACRFFQTVPQQQQSELLCSHPSPANRLKRLQKLWYRMVRQRAENRHSIETVVHMLSSL